MFQGSSASLANKILDESKKRGQCGCEKVALMLLMWNITCNLAEPFSAIMLKRTFLKVFFIASKWGFAMEQAYHFLITGLYTTILIIRQNVKDVLLEK